VSTVAELLKPITWFPPMWAFACGVVSSGEAFSGHWGLIVWGVLLAGPMVCASSQAVNDWFDRHVDAINEPQRPIPSGRMPGRWGLYIACLWTGLSLLWAVPLGTWGFLAAALGLEAGALAAGVFAAGALAAGAATFATGLATGLTAALAGAGAGLDAGLETGLAAVFTARAAVFFLVSKTLFAN
jgi:4-hydroxybenzoate polyprenyltransferase